MAKTFQSYISKLYVDASRNNDDIIKVETEYLSPEGDVFIVDRRTVSPVMVPTTSSIQELQPEVSTSYPYKIVTPLDIDSSTVILSPTIDTPVTASQNYYVPVYFELYKKEVLDAINKEFFELEGIVVEEPIVEEEV
jgi:hypothetical protein